MACPKMSVMACHCSRACMSCMLTYPLIRAQTKVRKVLLTSCLQNPSKSGAHPYLRSAHGPAMLRSTLHLLVRRLRVRFKPVVLSPFHHPPCFHSPAYLPTTLPASQHPS